MKKSIEINLGGRIFNIDEDAYELLNEYIEELRRYFKDNEECEEIVADIELRLGELCEARMCDGRARIVDYDMVVEFTARVGRPESLEGDEETSKEVPGAKEDDGDRGNASGKESREPWRDAMLLGKKYYRDTNNRVFGGVFGGLSAYSGINVWLLRVSAILLTLFVLEIIAVGLYLLAWLLFPYAKTVTERMRMREIKPLPGENSEDAWRREYERAVAEVLHNVGVSDNKGCLSGCIVAFLLFVLSPLILIVLFVTGVMSQSLISLGLSPLLGPSMLLFVTYMLIMLIVAILLFLVIYYILYRNGKVSSLNSKIKNVLLVTLLVLVAILVYVKVSPPESSFNVEWNSNTQIQKNAQSTMDELTHFMDGINGVVKSPEIAKLKDYFLLADSYAYSKKCTRILWHYIPSAASDSTVPFVSECTELDDKVIWKFMPRDEWVDFIDTPSSISQIEIVARTSGDSRLYCVVDMAARQMWIDLARSMNPGSVQVTTNSMPGWQVEVLNGGLPEEKSSVCITFALNSYRGVKIIKGVLPKLTVYETVNGKEEKKEVQHTVFRTREFK